MLGIFLSARLNATLRVLVVFHTDVSQDHTTTLHFLKPPINSSNFWYPVGVQRYSHSRSLFLSKSLYSEACLIVPSSRVIGLLDELTKSIKSALVFLSFTKKSDKSTFFSQGLFGISIILTLSLPSSSAVFFAHSFQASSLS